LKVGCTAVAGTAVTSGLNLLNVKAFYQPNGIFGVIYWYIFLPFHYIIFEGLIKQIEKRCDDNFKEILQPE